MARQCENALVLIDLSTLEPRIGVQQDVADALELGSTLALEVLPDLSRKTPVDVKVRIYGVFCAHDGTTAAPLTFLLRASSSGHEIFLRRTVRSDLVEQGLDRNADVPPPVKALWNLLESE